MLLNTLSVMFKIRILNSGGNIDDKAWPGNCSEKM